MDEVLTGGLLYPCASSGLSDAARGWGGHGLTRNDRGHLCGAVDERHHDSGTHPTAQVFSLITAQTALS